jgi:hypothetical protein
MDHQQASAPDIRGKPLLGVAVLEIEDVRLEDL